MRMWRRLAIVKAKKVGIYFNTFDEKNIILYIYIYMCRYVRENKKFLKLMFFSHDVE